MPLFHDCEYLMTIAVSKRRPQPEGYLRETEQIKQNKLKYGETVHKFKAAKWTHPNGHPRCVLCGQEQSMAPECNREATPEEEAETMRRITESVKKAGLPLWDGDGVQGAGQPRDRIGRWVGLPGPSSIKRIGAFLTGDGFEVVADKGKTQEVKTLKTKRAANKAVARAIREDADLYQKNVEEAEQEKARLAREKKNAAARERRKAKKQAEYESQFPQRRQPKPKAVPVAARPNRRSKQVKVSPVERLPVPGRPSQDQANKAGKWARQNLSDTEAKYAGLVIRLLKNKGITQDPAKRGELAERYGLDAGRLVQIERDVYEQMFPSAVTSSRRASAKGVVTDIASPSVKEMRKHGGKNPITMAGEKDRILKPDIMFKATRGPHKGKWVKVTTNGTVTPMTEKQADAARVKAKIFWTERQELLNLQNERKRKAYRERQRQLAEEAGEKWGPGEYEKALDWLENGLAGGPIELHPRSLETLSPSKFQKIKAAAIWAYGENLDHTDSYWWGFYWNDSSLITSGNRIDNPGEADVSLKPMGIRLTAGAALAREHMDPKLLEGILALPDIDSRKMRGQRPGGRRTTRDDDDFVPASPESRTVDPDWETKNEERSISHSRRMRMAYDRYMKKHPKSKLTLAEFTDNYYKNKLRIPGGSKSGIKKSRNPLWDGDGVQGIGQPRDRRGRWSDTGLGNLSRVMGMTDRVMQHHGSTTNRRVSNTAVTPGANKAAFKNGVLQVKLTRPNRGGTHIQVNPVTGKPLPKRKLTPEEAVTMRNVGPTAISNQRLKEIWENLGTSKGPTQLEFDMIMSARGQKAIDGITPIKTRTKAGARTEMPRYALFGQIYGQLTPGSGDRSAKRVDGRSAEARARADAKRRESKKENSIQQGKKKEAIAKLFSIDGKHCVCVICGKNVRNGAISLETPKPKKLGGNYADISEMFPACFECNEKAGARAKFDPKLYYQETIESFIKVTPPEVMRRLSAYKKAHAAAIARAKRKGVNYERRR
jgi:hypothetical protein